MSSNLKRMIKNSKENRTLKGMNYKNFCPYEKGISHTFITKWLGCRERARLHYVEGWRPKGFNVSLEFGNIFHEMMEKYYENFTQGTIAKAHKVADEYIIKKVEKNGLTPNETTDLDKLASLAKMTFEEYIDFWTSNPWDETETFTDKDTHWTSTEEDFLVPYRLPNGPVVKLVGKIDGTFIHPVTGNRMIFETKTKKQIDVRHLDKFLTTDHQTQLYTFCYQKAKKQLPQGTLYNVVRVTSMKPRKNENHKDYVGRVREVIQKDPKHFFKRWETEIDQHDIDRFRKTWLDPVLMGIVSWWESVKKNLADPFVNEDGSVNENHWVRPSGLYSGIGRDLADDYHEIIMDGDYFNYERK